MVGVGRGKVDGAERVLTESGRVPDNAIPLELWDPVERRLEHVDRETRAITIAPGTVGVNLAVLRPQGAAPNIVDKLMVEMPMVESDTFASGMISTADAIPAGSTKLRHQSPIWRVGNGW